jgi:mono/diheme cytochrome c family protein
MKKPKKNKPQAGTAKSTGESGWASGSGGGSSGPRSPGETRVTVRDVGGEPVAGRASVPVLLIALLGALIYFGDMYVVDHGGELDARVHQPFRTVKELDDLQVKAAEDPEMVLGRKNYKMVCSPCHQDDGNGNPGTGIPPLAGSEWLATKDPARVIRIVLNGLQGPVIVKGKTYSQAAMLPWRETLSDDDVAAVLFFVRNSWGNAGPKVNPEEVKAIRKDTADKTGNWTAPDLLSLPVKE